jgi:hypothetical protein
MLAVGEERQCVEALLALADIAQDADDVRTAFRLLDLAANISSEHARETPLEEDERAATSRDELLRSRRGAVAELAREFAVKKAPPEVARLIARAQEIGVRADGP